MKSLLYFLPLLLLVTVITFSRQMPDTSEPDEVAYTKLTYVEMRQKLKELALLYPEVMQLSNSKELFGIEHEVECEDKNRCVLDIVTLTDIQSKSEDKTQVYISGALHGNERLGPHASYYLIEFLVSNYGRDPEITNLLKRREIVITPMTNAPGFHYKMREEKMAGSGLNFASSVDINRDFPYN